MSTEIWGCPGCLHQFSSGAVIPPECPACNKSKIISFSDILLRVSYKLEEPEELNFDSDYYDARSELDFDIVWREI